MSNNITHELRTPVSSIRGYLETLTLCPQMDEARRRHFLEKAYAQSLRLSDLIRDVALITKTDEAPDLMPREDLAPADVIADVADELAEARQKAGMDLVVSVPADARMQGNYTLVHSILLSGKLNDTRLYCTIDIDMTETLEQVINVVIGQPLTTGIHSATVADRINKII